ncbi:MAG: heme o synthase [Verrucomicrobia bacterium]|nr:heme o synthase [Verrucomicrobiota bacterium]
MKSTAVPIESIQSPASTKEVIQAIVELSKARLSLMVVFTSAAGFYMGHSSGQPWVLSFFSTIFGTALLAAGAASLNQVIEVERDALMKRTASRPLVTGLLSMPFGIAFGLVTSLIGFLLLAIGANLLAAGLGLTTLASYLFLYTPLKTRSVWNTVIGAIPGALPPLIGWTASTGVLNLNGWLLFLLLFAWQIPHFMAIAWIYRDEYLQAGYKMLPSIDPKGLRCGRQSVIYSLLLVQVSLLMVSQKMVGFPFLIIGSILGLTMVVLAIRFSIQPGRKSARILFFSSIIYLPFQLILMVSTKINSGHF